MIKNRRCWQKQNNHLKHLIIWVGLIITPFLILLLWDGMGNVISNFQSQRNRSNQMTNFTAMEEPFYPEGVNRSTYNMHHLINRHKNGEFWPRIFPYSVVDGGVHSVQELRSAIWRDPVVAKHYSNFNIDKARVIEAKADRNFHVSYRIGDEIFWTKKKLKVAKGEKLITDDTNVSRTRCANILSEVLPGRTSPDEPAPEVFNEPLDPLVHEFLQEPNRPLIVSQNPPETTPTSPNPGSGTNETPPLLEPTPFIPPVLIGGGPPGPTPTPPPGPGPGPGPAPVPVPEPNTILFIGFGLASLWGFRKKFEK